MEIKTEKILTKQQLKETSPLVLAFIGDGIHTLFVRDFVVTKNLQKLNDYNRQCSTFCKAKTQSKVLDLLVCDLTEEEKDVVRRTRNTKTHNIAKNSNLVEYKKATCFEALVGWLYLSGQNQRLNEILQKSLIEEGNK